MTPRELTALALITLGATTAITTLATISWEAATIGGSTIAIALGIALGSE